MDILPPEIWSEIFSHSCTDDGRTGCSLSLVSHFFSECSKPYKLQSVVVLGLTQLFAFADLLERTPSPLRRVKHILLSSKSLREAADQHLFLADKPETQKMVHSVGERILRAITPSVRVLHAFFMIDPSSTCVLLPVSLPVLEELVIHGLLGMAGPGTDIEFISLKRLTLTLMNWSTDAFDQSLKQTPRLTHLTLRPSNEDGRSTFYEWSKGLKRLLLPSHIEKMGIHSFLSGRSKVLYEGRVCKLDNRVELLPRWHEKNVTIETVMTMWAASASYSH